MGSTVVELEAAAPRVSCPDHGVVVAAVAVGETGSRFTRAFEDMCAWLAAHTSATAQLGRVTWRSVTAIVERVVADAVGSRDLLEGVTRIGIDEIAHRKGHRLPDGGRRP